ncbi:serine/arginine repetitive matrix protein 1-like [Equus przewalskii]|uniref:Serine/arginine repetitive matrix protein 1-like n=1 Tax=Equus przewalskii TaxID=9798 RepID=A0ABM4JN08_EQUPR
MVLRAGSRVRGRSDPGCAGSGTPGRETTWAPPHPPRPRPPRLPLRPPQGHVASRAPPPCRPGAAAPRQSPDARGGTRQGSRASAELRDLGGRSRSRSREPGDHRRRGRGGGGARGGHTPEGLPPNPRGRRGRSTLSTPRLCTERARLRGQEVISAPPRLSPTGLASKTAHVRTHLLPSVPPAARARARKPALALEFFSPLPSVECGKESGDFTGHFSGELFASWQCRQFQPWALHLSFPSGKTVIGEGIARPAS